MGAAANNNAVINCHLFLCSPHVCLVQVYLETFNDIKKFNTEVQLCC